MSRYLRGNEDEDQKEATTPTSQFARQIMQHVGGSCVYIEPKKTKKLVDIEEIK